MDCPSGISLLDFHKDLLECSRWRHKLSQSLLYAGHPGCWKAHLSPEGGRRGRLLPSWSLQQAQGCVPPRAGPAALRPTRGQYSWAQSYCLDCPQREASVLCSVPTELSCWASWHVTWRGHPGDTPGTGSAWPSWVLSPQPGQGSVGHQDISML